MDELNSKFKSFLVLCLLSLVFFLFMSNIVFGDETLFLNRVTIEQTPCLIKLYVDKEVSSKFIKVERKEILLALKNVRPKPGLKIIGSKGPLIKTIVFQQLQGNVAAVLVTGNHDFIDAKVSYNKAESCFIINLEKAAKNLYPKTLPEKIVTKTKKVPPKKQKIKVIQQKVAKEKQTIEKKETPKKKSVKSDEKGKGYIPPEKGKSNYAGDISDILLKANIINCSSNDLIKAVALLKKERYKDSLALFEKFFSLKNQTCMEQASYLRAYAYYMYAIKSESLNIVEAEHYFHESLIAYPDSKLLPFGFTALGLIHMKMNNPAVAEGYFTIVRDGYKEYSSLAQVYYYLAEIYKQREFNDKALRYFKVVFEGMPDNNYTIDAGIGLGKTLFEKRHYLDAINIFKYITEQDKEKIYNDFTLLLTMGNANIKLGRSIAARENFTRVINLFPKIAEKDIIFSQIADTYAMENNFEKAKSMYAFVRKEYPDGEGFIRSSIGLARYLEERKEREKLYTMVKKRFPDNKFSRVAMMRLAEIYQEHKEYEKCIKEIEELLTTNPMGLRYEAVRLMQKAYEALFESILKTDRYTDILRKYEENFVRLDRMTSRKISLSVGLSYLEADLYEQAFNHLISAYKLYKRSQRPAELLFGMGVAMDETDRDDDAVKLLNGFVKKFTKNPDRTEAYLRMSKIYLSKDEYAKSGVMFERAYKSSKDYLEKSKILIEKAKLYEKQQQWDKVTFVLANAVQDFLLASKKDEGLLSSIYRTMGNAYLKQHIYVRAAESFSQAVKFSESDDKKANLQFMMGDAYQKANVLIEAKKIFKDIVKQSDSVWARLAEQRLSTLTLAENAKNS